MGYAKVNKYIDLYQFPRDKNGNISWKDSVGMIVDFYYYNKDGGYNLEKEIKEYFEQRKFTVKEKGIGWEISL